MIQNNVQSLAVHDLDLCTNHDVIGPELCTKYDVIGPELCTQYDGT